MNQIPKIVKALKPLFLNNPITFYLLPITYYLLLVNCKLLIVNCSLLDYFVFLQKKVI